MEIKCVCYRLRGCAILLKQTEKWHKLGAAVNPVEAKYKQNISLLMNLNVFLCLPAPCWRLHDEVALCELVTGTALFMLDQPSPKSRRQWCVSTSSWDESPWCLLTGLIPQAREANKECSFAQNTCFRANSIWPKWDRGKRGLKRTNRKVWQRDKQGWDESMHSSMLPQRQNYTTASNGQKSFIDLFCFSNRIRFKWKHNPDS